MVYLKKKGLNVSEMLRILRLSYPKSRLPSCKDITKYFTILRRRRIRRNRLKVKKRPYNKTPDRITQLVLRSCMETGGLESTPDLTARIRKETGHSVSTRTIRRIRRFYGYRYRRLRKAPYLTELHKLNRLKWCLTHQYTDFSNWVFVDETTVRLWDLPLYHWRLRSSRPEAIPMTEKYRNKLNVWGGMSHKGLSRFAVS